jgi:hypothetical protein
MRSPTGSALLFLVVLLSASLGAGLPSGASPVVADELMSRRSLPQAVKAACALPDRCVGQASAAEPDESRPIAAAAAAARALQMLSAAAGTLDGVEAGDGK